MSYVLRKYILRYKVKAPAFFGTDEVDASMLGLLLGLQFNLAFQLAAVPLFGSVGFQFTIN